MHLPNSYHGKCSKVQKGQGRSGPHVILVRESSPAEGSREGAVTGVKKCQATEQRLVDVSFKECVGERDRHWEGEKAD